jgi:hypothetical protein
MTAALFAAAALAGPAAAAQSHASHPAHQGHDAHAAGVDQRGDEVMGFSHTRTAHHFRLTRDGGVIDVASTSADDTASRDQIRRHLREVAKAFAQGDFSMPEAIHGRVPPGADAMKKGRAAIAYRYEDTERGGRVRISTADPALVEAVHAFLRFQIEDHRTGDPLEVEEPGREAQ